MGRQRPFLAVCIENLIRFECLTESLNVSDDGLTMLLSDAVGLAVQVEDRLEAENAALRHQLIVLQRKVRGRVHFTNSDRLFFIQLYRWFPSVLRLRFQSNGMPPSVTRWIKLSKCSKGDKDKRRSRARIETLNCRF